MRKWWKRKPMFVPDVERTPSFLMNGEKIVEVVFCEWTSQPDGTWFMSRGAAWTMEEEADKIIHERPDGCYEQQLRFAPGAWSLGIGHGVEIESAAEFDVPVTLCQRTQEARAKFFAEEVTNA